MNLPRARAIKIKFAKMIYTKLFTGPLGPVIRPPSRPKKLAIQATYRWTPGTHPTTHLLITPFTTS